jgi:arylsulfatase A-like enzyme
MSPPPPVTPDGAGKPTRRFAPSPTPTASLESVLAIGLCLVVVFSALAFMERSRVIARTLQEMHVKEFSRPRRMVPPRGAFPGADARPSLVVLLSLDTLRADHLDLYGYERETAPNLRRLGEESVVFTMVAAQATQTLVSHKSLLTGKYPLTLMLEETGADLLTLTSEPDPHRYLVETMGAVQPTLAAGLRQRGYRTAGFTDGAWMGRDAGFDLGFDHFDDSGGGLAGVLPRVHDWLASKAADTLFVFAHAYDTHCPYTTREPFESAFCPDHSRHLPLGDKCGKGGLNDMALSAADWQAVVDHYDAGILAADDLVGRFLEALREQGLYDRALIVITSDHGESLGERGYVGHGGLHVEELSVPLIVRFPSSWNVTPRRVDEPVELVDLLPTIFTLCGVPTTPDLDGSSLLPIVFRGVRGRDFLVAQTTFEEPLSKGTEPTARTLLRPGRWQVVQDPRQLSSYFYNLESDPRGLTGRRIPEEEFGSLLDALTVRGEAGRKGRRREPTITFSPELASELASLGYGAAPLPEAGDEPATGLR